MPLTPFVQNHREQNGTDKRYTDFLHSIVDKHPHVVVLDSRYAKYDASVFVDPTHLDREGASVLTTEVARLIKPYLSPQTHKPSQSWVSLPRFNPSTPVGFRVEDVAESGELLKQRALDPRVVR
jgi:hypothetical protein